HVDHLSRTHAGRAGPAPAAHVVACRLCGPGGDPDAGEPRRPRGCLRGDLAPAAAVFDVFDARSRARERRRRRHCHGAADGNPAMSRVDVIVPCYNYGNMLRACVRSVLDQEDADVRVIVMDDASTDSTEAVGRRLAAEDPRVEYRRHATNCGHIATYNEALADVTADYCMI